MSGKSWKFLNKGKRRKMKVIGYKELPADHFEKIHEAKVAHLKPFFFDEVKEMTQEMWDKLAERVLPCK